MLASYDNNPLNAMQSLWCMQGEAVAQAGNCSEAEGLFLRAKQPDLALQMYRAALMWDDALRIAEDYLPAKVCLLQRRVPLSCCLVYTNGHAFEVPIRVCLKLISMCQLHLHCKICRAQDQDRVLMV